MNAAIVEEINAMATKACDDVMSLASRIMNEAPSIDASYALGAAMQIWMAIRSDVIAKRDRDMFMMANPIAFFQQTATKEKKSES